MLWEIRLDGKGNNVFIISLHIHDIRSLEFDPLWDFLRSHSPRHINKGSEGELLILIVLTDSNGVVFFAFFLHFML